MIAFAARLTQCIRQSDIPARLGGDEFVVVLEFLSQGMADAETVARKIIDAMREPLIAYDQALTLSTSIGIASFQSCGQDARMCVNMADEALYTAKRAGKKPLRLSAYGPSLKQPCQSFQQAPTQGAALD